MGYHVMGPGFNPWFRGGFLEPLLQMITEITYLQMITEITYTNSGKCVIFSLYSARRSFIAFSRDFGTLKPSVAIVTAGWKTCSQDNVPKRSNAFW
jgi:hypothetical protein